LQKGYFLFLSTFFLSFTDSIESIILGSAENASVNPVLLRKNNGKREIFGIIPDYFVVCCQKDNGKG